jgi:glycosyltransferase involved in cell wall biosynthesis
MRVGVVLAHGRPSGGVRRMIKFGRSLSDRGPNVRFLYIGGRPLPDEQIELTEVPWAKIPDETASLDAVICPGDLPLWHLASTIPRNCRLIAMHLHFGVHQPDDQVRNIQSPLMLHATTANWIRQEIAKLGASCTLIGPGPIDDDLFEIPVQRGHRIGTLSHPAYGWKNSRAVADAYFALKAEFPGAELWSYGVAPIENYPGRFFLRPSVATRRFIYSSCRVWVVPSIAEGLGMTGFDAMQCRTPVVSADNRGIREYADEATCQIFHPARSRDMHDAIRLLLKDWQLGTDLADRAFERIKQFTWNKCMDRLEALLTSTPSDAVSP